MTRKRSFRIIFVAVLIVSLILPASVASAQTPPSVPPPIAIKGPRLAPPPIPHSDVLDPYMVYNFLVSPDVPVQSLEANAADGGRLQEKPGRGIRQTSTSVGFGILLYPGANVCNDFNANGSFASVAVKSDIWTDWYGGWAPFAIDDGYYQAKNVTFSRERVVGPGSKYNDEVVKNDGGPDQNSVKIGSNQPYAGGFGSPRIAVPKGYGDGQVMVSVKYLIWDHDSGGKEGDGDGFDYDWASMGIKAGADSQWATYVNGYVRGEWAELTYTIPLKGANDVMVLLQGQSPGNFNSNIYFDDVQIAFINAAGEGRYLKDCTVEEAVK